jgi:hypothetical protein
MPSRRCGGNRASSTSAHRRFRGEPSLSLAASAALQTASRTSRISEVRPCASTA